MKHFLDNLPIDPMNLIALLAALASLMAVGGLVAAISSARNKGNARVRGLKQRGTHAPEVKVRAERQRKVQVVGYMRGLVEKLRLLGTEQSDQAVKALSAAGRRNKDAVVVFLFAKVALPFVFGGLAVLYVYVLQILQLTPTFKLLVCLLAVVFGTFLPNIWVKNLTERRQQALRKGLPDSLDLLVICAEAGLSLDAALNRVAREMHGACPEMADELQLTANELGFLPERRQALVNLSERTQMEQIRGVVNTLLQTEKYGTPLAQSLRVLAAEFRNERMMKAEEKAAKLPAVLTLPLIVFILPTLFVVLLGPAIMSTMDGLLSL